MPPTLLPRVGLISTQMALLLVGSPLSAAALDRAGLESALRDWSGDRPGAIVALAVDGEATGFAAAGRWSATDPRPADENTWFEIGSITKVFTALLVADAVAEHRLAWQDVVGAPFAASPVTYAQLATHTAGLPRLPRDFPDPGAADPYANIGLPALVRSFALEAAALGTGPHAWSYSNFGAAVLGTAAATAWDGDYPTVLRRRVLDRLGLHDTWLSGPADGGVELARLAPGHTETGLSGRWRFDAYAPAGALVSTAHDMERFIRALLDPVAAGLPAAWGETMTVRTDATDGAQMGYGWFISTVEGAPVYWHGGGTGGYRSFVGVQPASGRGIVVLGASDRAVEGIGLGWLQGVVATAAKSSDGTVGEIDLEAYVGDYPLAPSFIMAVTVADGRLHLQATRQPRVDLRPTGPDAFAIEGVPAAVTFERDAAGTVVAMVLHQNGADQRAPRRPPGTVPPRRVSVTLSVDQLEPLVGEYELAPQVVLTITRHATQLLAQLTGQPRFPVFASAPDAFFYEVVEARLTFERDSQGAVTGLVLHQNGRDLPARKR